MDFLKAEKAVKRATSNKSRLPLLRGIYICNRELTGIGRRKFSSLLNNLVKEGTFSNIHNPRKNRRLKTEAGIRTLKTQENHKKRALAIRSSVNLKLKELDSLIENAVNETDKATLIAIQAQLIKKVEIKQNAISNEINNHLFLVLNIVEEKLKGEHLDTNELKTLLDILKDCSAIVGLIGKTPLIAQQFNTIENGVNPDGPEKIKAIEIEIINESKD
ncbi:hypothetical protein [Helicobacter ganmani]|uniref:hypothetical protein n=1 Tax=Helicobacter ganmani TaxID=60246 RepID=UPI003A8B4CE2